MAELGRLIVFAVLDLTLFGWRATVIEAEDDSGREPPTDEWLYEHLRPAINLQACRGGGIFIAAIPEHALS